MVTIQKLTVKLLGIPIQIHSKHKKYIPELIFGELLTGSNFDDTVAKVTGGRNGLGLYNGIVDK